MTKKTGKLAATTDSWEDSLGQKISPGDFIAVATISGRSPQMVIAQLERINTHNNEGKPFGAHSKAYPASAYEESDFETRTRTRPDGTIQTLPGKVRTVTLTCTPLFDGRGFHRSRGKWSFVGGKYVHDGSDKVRPATYRVVGNVVKMDMDQVVAMLEKQELEELEEEMKKI